MSMQPLTITATLPFGIALSHPWGTSLDGLLASVLWHRQKAASRNTIRPDTYDPAQIPPDLALPLARCTLGDVWHWACTFADLRTPLDAPETHWLTRHTDHTGMQRLAATVPTTVSNTRGHYRNRHTPALITVTTTATWHAIGSCDEIRNLLEELPAIGKHRNAGEGTVSAWTVQPSPVDTWTASHCNHPGFLGRIAPTGCLAGRPTVAHSGSAHMAVRAPYIHRSRYTAAFLPATPATFPSPPPNTHTRARDQGL